MQRLSSSRRTRVTASLCAALLGPFAAVTGCQRVITTSHEMGYQDASLTVGAARISVGLLGTNRQLDSGDGVRRTQRGSPWKLVLSISVDGTDAVGCEVVISDARLLERDDTLAHRLEPVYRSVFERSSATPPQAVTGQFAGGIDLPHRDYRFEARIQPAPGCPSGVEAVNLNMELIAVERSGDGTLWENLQGI